MPLSESAEFEGLQDPDKVIVRSDGTVTYVGKDIAYQLWKFGLLGRDFAYRYRMDRGLWTTALVGADEPPRFGRATRVINVIDARQSYLQKIVRAGLEALGHHDEAERSVHFAYEMVSLSQAAAKILGVAGDDEAGEKKTLEMSGRKGIGVKADDLLDDLGRIVYRQRTERGEPGDDDEIARLVGELRTLESDGTEIVAKGSAAVEDQQPPPPPPPSSGP